MSRNIVQHSARSLRVGDEGGRRRQKRVHVVDVTFVWLVLVMRGEVITTVNAGGGSRGGGLSRNSITAARKFWWHEKSRAPQIHGLLRSVPALSSSLKQRNSNDDPFEDYIKTTQEVSSVQTKKKPEPAIATRSSMSLSGGVNPEFFLGITPQTMISLRPSTSRNYPTQKKESKKRVDLREGMSEALKELKSMRHEMEAMRKELATLKQLQMGEEAVLDPEADARSKAALSRRQRQRQRDFEQLGAEVERWAEEILFPKATDEDKLDGWTEIPCNKLLKAKFNRNDRTRTYLKWMQDSRGQSHVTKGTTTDNQEWPCIRMYSTIEAPCHEVFLYLSQEQRATEYNQLLDQFKDLEDLSPHSKICWARSPQILFIKPRDFITFCFHRWRKDGTQVVVNQACDVYDDITANAFALRGATFIGPDPDDPDKTRIAMLAHASPGKDIPIWACKTAIQSLAPIEPYRLFHKINEGVKRSRVELEAISRRLNEAEMVSTERTSRWPAGIAQLGYACFWPNGGGEKECFSSQLQESDDNSEEGGVSVAPLPQQDDEQQLFDEHVDDE